MQLPRGQYCENFAYMVKPSSLATGLTSNGGNSDLGQVKEGERGLGRLVSKISIGMRYIGNHDYGRICSLWMERNL